MIIEIEILKLVYKNENIFLGIYLEENKMDTISDGEATIDPDAKKRAKEIDVIEIEWENAIYSENDRIVRKYFQVSTYIIRQYLIIYYHYRKIFKKWICVQRKFQGKASNFFIIHILKNMKKFEAFRWNFSLNLVQFREECTFTLRCTLRIIFFCTV